MISNARVDVNGSDFSLATLVQQFGSSELVARAKDGPVFGQKIFMPAAQCVRNVSPGNRPVVSVNLADNGLRAVGDMVLMPHVARDFTTHIDARQLTGDTTVVTPEDGSIAEKLLSRHTLNRRADHIVAPVVPGLSPAEVVASGMQLDVIAMGLAGMVASLQTFGLERNGEPRQIHPVDASECIFPVASSLRESKYCISDPSILARIFDNDAAVGMTKSDFSAPSYCPIFIPMGGQISAMAVLSSLSRNEGQPFYRETKSCYSALDGLNVRVICVVEGGALSRPLPKLSGDALVDGIEGALAILAFNNYPMDRYYGHVHAFMHNTPVWGGRFDWRTQSQLPATLVQRDVGNSVFPHNVGPAGDREQDPDVDVVAVPPAGVGGDLTQAQINDAVRRDLGASSVSADPVNRLLYGSYSRNGYGQPLNAGQDEWYVTQVRRISLGELGYMIPCNNRDTTVHAAGGVYLTPRMDAWRTEDGNGAANAPNNNDIAGPGFARNGQENILEYGPLTFLPGYGRIRLLVVMDAADVNYPANVAQFGLDPVGLADWEAYLTLNGAIGDAAVNGFPDFTGLPNYGAGFTLHSVTDRNAFAGLLAANAALPLSYYIVIENNLGRDESPMEAQGDLALRFVEEFRLAQLSTRLTAVGQGNVAFQWPTLIKNACVSDEASMAEEANSNNTFNECLRNAVENVFRGMPDRALKIGAVRYSVVQIWALIWSWTRWPDWTNSLRHEVKKSVAPPNPYGYVDGRHCYFVGGAYAPVEVRIMPGLWSLAYILTPPPGTVFRRRLPGVNIGALLTPDVVVQSYVALRSAADVAHQYLRASRLTVDDQCGRLYESIPDMIRGQVEIEPSLLRQVGLLNTRLLPYLVLSVCSSIRTYPQLVFSAIGSARFYPREAGYRVDGPNAPADVQGYTFYKHAAVVQILPNSMALGMLLVPPITGQLPASAVKVINGLRNVDGCLVMDPMPDVPVTTVSLVSDLLLGMGVQTARLSLRWGWGERRILWETPLIGCDRAALGRLPTDVLAAGVMLEYAPLSMTFSPPFSVQITNFRPANNGGWWGGNAQPGVPNNVDPAFWRRVHHLDGPPNEVRRIDARVISSYGPEDRKRSDVSTQALMPNDTAAIVAALTKGAFPTADSGDASLPTGFVPDPSPEEPPGVPEVNEDLASAGERGVGGLGRGKIKLDPLQYAQLLRQAVVNGTAGQFMDMFDMDVAAGVPSALGDDSETAEDQ